MTRADRMYSRRAGSARRTSTHGGGVAERNEGTTSTPVTRPLRGWQVTCAECAWNMHSVHREHAEAGKHEHEQSTGHHDVTVYPVSEGEPTGGRHGRQEK